MSHKISLGTCRANRLRLMRIIYSASKDAEPMSFAVQSIHQPAEKNRIIRRGKNNGRTTGSPGPSLRRSSEQFGPNRLNTSSNTLFTSRMAHLPGPLPYPELYFFACIFLVIPDTFWTTRVFLCQEHQQTWLLGEGSIRDAATDFHNLRFQDKQPAGTKWKIMSATGLRGGTRGSIKC